MTSEGGKRERSERQTASEDRAGSEATREGGKRERSERQTASDGSSGERSDPRDGGSGDADDFEFSLSPDEPEGADESPSFPGGDAEGDDTGTTDDTRTDGGMQAEEAMPDDADLPDGDDDEVEPVEVLVTLAEDGEIDPWDIDIVEVTDAFLEHLDATDLRTSGRALFYASVLLRMKSDAMLADDDEEEDEPEPWELAMEGGGDDGPVDDGFDPVNALEDEMDRRLDRKSTRGNPETLDELVRELREAERGSWWKESRSYDTSESPHGYDRGTQTLDYHAGDDLRRDGEPTEGDVTETTHTEDIDEVIGDVRERLDAHYDRGREEVLFAEIRDAGGRPVMTYLALLFLAHRGGVKLEQDDLFGDLWVQDPNAVEDGSEGEEDESEGDDSEEAEVVATDD